MSKVTRISLYLGLAGVLSLLGSGCSPQARSARLLKRANTDFSANRFDAAEIEYMNLLRIDRLNAQAIGRLGIIYLNEGIVSKAIPFLIEARKLEPDNRDVRLWLGLYFLAAGKNQEAMDEGNHILAGNAADDEAPPLLARAAMGTKAMEALRQRLGSLPATAAKGAPVLVALGTLESRQGHRSEAEALFRRALAVDPNSVNANLALGGLSIEENDLARADQALGRAAELAPDRPAIGMQYAQLKLKVGARDAGVKLLEQICEQTPGFLPARVLLAQMALLEGKYDACEAMIARILARDPAYPDALMLTGRLLLAKGEPAQAVAELERTEKAYSESADVEYQLAQAYLATGAVEKAVIRLNRAAVLAPDFADAIILAAKTDIDRGDYGLAIVALKGLAQTRPDLPQVPLVLASAYLGENEADDAFAVYEALAVARPLDPQPLVLEGAVRERQKRRDEARRLFDQALALAPNYLPALEQEVDLDLKEKRYGPALQRVGSQIAQHPTEPELRLLQGRVQAAQKAWADAEASLKQAIELRPDAPDAYFILAEIYSAAGEDAAALGDLGRMVAKNPQDARALMLMGAISIRQGDYRSAGADYEKIVAFAPGCGPALIDLAWLCAEKFAQIDRAEVLAKRARVALPNEPRVADTLGWILYRQQDYRGALSLLTESAGRLPADAEIQFHLGMTYSMLGEEGPAGVALDRALQAGANFPGIEEAHRRRSLLAIDPRGASPADRAVLEKAAALAPGDPVAVSRLAVVYEQDHALDKAIALCETALLANAYEAPVISQLARLEATRGDLPKAFALAKKAHEIAPQDPEISHNLGTLAVRSGYYPWAASLLQESAAKEPDNPDVLFDLGQADYGIGLVPKAESALRQALATKTPWVRAAEARRFLEFVDLANDPAQAVAAAGTVEQALAAEPQDVPALMAMGAICEHRGEAALAKQNYEKVLHRYPEFLPAKRGLALVCAEHPDGDAQALELAAKAWEAYPGDPAVARACGIIAYRIGDYASAARLLAEGDDAGDGSDGQRLFYLGMARHRLKEHPDLELLRRALALNLRADLAADARRVLAEAK